MRMSTIVTAVLIPVVVSALLTKLQRDGAKEDQNATDTDFTMRLPGIVFWIGFLCTLLGTVFLVLLLLTEDEGGILEAILGACAMICLGAILMLYACMFRISVKDERITVRALLKKPYSFTFREIESVTRDIESRGGQVESLTIRTSTGKKLKVESIFISYPRLFARIQQEVDSARLSNASFED